MANVKTQNGDYNELLNSGILMKYETGVSTLRAYQSHTGASAGNFLQLKNQRGLTGKATERNMASLKLNILFVFPA